MPLVNPSRTREIGDVEGIEFAQEVGAVTANSFKLFDFKETAPFDTYAPFDELRIFNDSNSKVRININQRTDKYEYVAGKTEKTIKHINLYTCLLTEMSGSGISASTNTITLVAVKQGATVDTLSKRIARKFGGLF